MRKFGGYLGKRPTAPSYEYATGIWDLNDQDYYQRLQNWPIVFIDPLFDNVHVLLHMNGSGSTFIDSSKYNRTLTVLGNATQTSAQSKFGGVSGSFGGAGALNTGLAFNSTTFGTQNFVIEGWFFVVLANNFNWLMGARNTNIIGGIHLVYYSGTWKNEFTFDGINWQRINNLSIPNNQWFYYALVRNGTSLTAYVNGVSQGSFSVGTNAFFGDSGGITLFSAGSTLDSSATGYADEFRITIGSNRGYVGSSISIPQYPFANQ